MSNNLRDSLKLRKTNIKHYFPDVLANAVEFKEFAKTVDPELNCIIGLLVEKALNTSNIEKFDKEKTKAFIEVNKIFY